jgi:hypothetical protein
LIIGVLAFTFERVDADYTTIRLPRLFESGGFCPIFKTFVEDVESLAGSFLTGVNLLLSGRLPRWIWSDSVTHVACFAYALLEVCRAGFNA